MPKCFLLSSNKHTFVIMHVLNFVDWIRLIEKAVSLKWQRKETILLGRRWCVCACGRHACDCMHLCATMDVRHRFGSPSDFLFRRFFFCARTMSKRQTLRVKSQRPANENDVVLIKNEPSYSILQGTKENTFIRIGSSVRWPAFARTFFFVWFAVVAAALLFFSCRRFFFYTQHELISGSGCFSFSSYSDHHYCVVVSLSLSPIQCRHLYFSHFSHFERNFHSYSLRLAQCLSVDRHWFGPSEIVRQPLLNVTSSCRCRNRFLFIVTRHW